MTIEPRGWSADRFRPARASTEGGRSRTSRIFSAVLAMVLLSVFAPLSFAAKDNGSAKAVRRDGVSSADPETPSSGKGDLYALVVGVADYKIPKLRLKVSDNDARQFAEFLKSQKGVFNNTYVNLLVNEAATKVEIEKLIHYGFLRAGKDDTVILFFSGHGSGDPKKPGDFFFLGYDADPEYLEATAVKMSGLDFLRGMHARRVLVVADACHAGAFSQVRTKSLERAVVSFARRFAESSGRAVLTSSSPEEYSQEKVGLNNSVFTYYLLKGLNGEADGDRDGVVTLREAYDYVYDRTKNETGGAQHPQLEGTVTGPFPISVLGKFDEPLKMEASFIAQDPRCTNKDCLDPPHDGFVCHDPLCKDVEIKEGDTLYSGQHYQIAVRPVSPCYVYVYQGDSSGDIYRLFPGKDYMDPDNNIANPLEGGRIYWIPGKESWLTLQEDQEGMEKIYVVASRTRNLALEDLYAHVEKLKADGRLDASDKEARGKLLKFLDRTMGPTKAVKRKARTASGDEKVRSFEGLSGFFESDSLDAVRSVSFLHRAR